MLVAILTYVRPEPLRERGRSVLACRLYHQHCSQYILMQLRSLMLPE